LKSLCVWLVSI